MKTIIAGLLLSLSHFKSTHRPHRECIFLWCSPVKTAHRVHHLKPRLHFYRQWWLVTWYAATGNPMSNGIYPSVGWAACGYDVGLNTRVSVPGIGTLTCGDRIGMQPYRHIDVFGIPLGTSYRLVTIYR